MDKQDFFRHAHDGHPGPMEGIRVLEIATTWAGPLCASLLGDYGAEVIKIEDLEGEIARKLPPFLPGREKRLSFMNATVNRNKRSLTLDLRRRRAQKICRDLAQLSDVVVENFRPGTLSSWGLGYDDLAAVKPDLIYVSISGYGQYGPDADRVGYDPLAQAGGGFMALNGDPAGGPVKAATWLADDLAGMHGALAAMAALRHRERSGEGQHIDVSLLDAMLAGSNGGLTLGAMGVDLPRMGSEFVFASPANVYACADGHIFAGALLDSHWKRVARLVGRADLAEHEDFATALGRIGQRDTINSLVGDFCAERSTTEVVRAFTAEGLPAAAVRSFKEAAADPHVRERDMLQSVAQEDGIEAPVTGPPAKLSRTPLRVRSGAPGLGEHTREILSEVGLSDSDIETLRNDGVI